MTKEEAEREVLVEWDDKYSVKIPLIDEQHKELLEHTNTLYRGCLSGTEEERIAHFMEAVHIVVDYTKYHFSAEEKMLENVKYPELARHRKEHEGFVQKIVDDVKSFQNGEKFVPNNFVRFLKDWILSHIAMEDTKYSQYIFSLKKSGQLDKRLNG
jgi:hemerythrin